MLVSVVFPANISAAKTPSPLNHKVPELESDLSDTSTGPTESTRPEKRRAANEGPNASDNSLLSGLPTAVASHDKGSFVHELRVSSLM